MEQATENINNTKSLGRQEIKTLGLSSLGGALEFYDFVIYALYVDLIVAPLFFPESLSPFTRELFAWGIFAAGYLIRPVGGVVMAHFGDKLGRKKMFTFSIALMALPTLIIGVLPTFETIGILAPILLLVMRMLQGAAIGGEMPGAWVFIAEHTPKSHYGFGVGTLTSGITGGILLGFLVSILIDSIYTKQEILDFAWRIPFIIGGGFGIVSVYLRRFLSETPIFKKLAERKELESNIPVISVIKNHKKSVFISWSHHLVIINHYFSWRTYHAR